MSAIETLQQHLGVPRSGAWDQATYGALVAYQSSHGLDPTGHPDPATLMKLGYYTPDDIFTKRWADYLAGGAKPGSFGRDLRASIDQVPRWAWGVMAASFGVFAYVAYRTDRKRERRVP